MKKGIAKIIQYDSSSREESYYLQDKPFLDSLGLDNFFTLEVYKEIILKIKRHEKTEALRLQNVLSDLSAIKEIQNNFSYKNPGKVIDKPEKEIMRAVFYTGDKDEKGKPKKIVFKNPQAIMAAYWALKKYYNSIEVPERIDNPESHLIKHYGQKLFNLLPGRPVDKYGIIREIFLHYGYSEIYLDKTDLNKSIY